MVTEKQLVANRENALKGGVKTDEGKAIVRFNALKHGLLCKYVLLRSEDEAALIELREQLIAELQPEGAFEEILVERIVSSLWRLNRAIKIETKYIEAQFNNVTGSQKGVGVFIAANTSEVGLHNVWLNLIRYETTIERQIYKAMHELQRVKMERDGAKPPAPIAIDIDMSNQG